MQDTQSSAGDMIYDFVRHIGSHRVHIFVRHSTVAGVRHKNRILSPAEAKKAEIQLSKEPGGVTARAQQLELPRILRQLN